MVNPAFPLPHMACTLLRMRFASLSLALAIALSPAAAETIPKPKLRPQRIEQPVRIVIPIPRLRPLPEEPDATETAAPSPPQTPPSAKWPTPGRGWSSAAVAVERGRCDTLLRNLDIVFEPQPPLGTEGGCGAAAPVLVSKVAGVALTPPAAVTCPMAAALHGWIATSVKPAAKQRLKTEVTEIHAAASYVCRRRNNARSGKLSEHGRANALDISGFSFARSDSVTVGGGGWGGGILKTLGISGSGSFLGDIRKGACTYFTTVLGPGSDPYHGDHFHVDALERRGGYHICK